MGGSSSRVTCRPNTTAMKQMKRSASMLLRSGVWAQSPFSLFSPFGADRGAWAASFTARASTSVCFIRPTLARPSIVR